MLQREVAERIEAQPGTKDYGVLSIFVQLHADVRRLLDAAARRVPAGAEGPFGRDPARFRPPAVVLTDEPAFEAMVRSMFTQRRKTLSNALKPFAAERGADARRRAGRRRDRSGARRPETLQLEELARLAEFFASRMRASCAIVCPLFRVPDAVPAGSQVDIGAWPCRACVRFHPPGWRAAR